ncbi:hypothetical protein B0H13DRAFT_2306292 [Mycena leptocephala]|nr:hypothetical protein B0H13DRAFT_2306292 [Mycena leptocephala]
MSDISLFPSCADDLMSRTPGVEFFCSEQGVEATSLLGTYAFPDDFTAAVTANTGAGSRSLVYHSEDSGQPLPGHTATRFSKDISILRDVMRQETSEDTVISRPWVEDIAGVYESTVILVDCGPYTKIINGPLTVGSAVVVDVTLHRQDKVVGPVSIKAYSIFAHEVERIGRYYLLTAGVVQRMDPSLSAFEEQLKILEYLMQDAELTT